MLVCVIAAIEIKSSSLVTKQTFILTTHLHFPPLLYPFQSNSNSDAVMWRIAHDQRAPAFTPLPRPTGPVRHVPNFPQISARYHPAANQMREGEYRARALSCSRANRFASSVCSKSFLYCLNLTTGGMRIYSPCRNRLGRGLNIVLVPCKSLKCGVKV